MPKYASILTAQTVIMMCSMDKAQKREYEVFAYTIDISMTVNVIFGFARLDLIYFDASPANEKNHYLLFEWNLNLYKQ